MKTSKARPVAPRTSGKVPPAAPTNVVGPPAQVGMWPYAVGAALAAVVVFLVYGPALRGPFLLDDTYLPYRQPAYWDSTIGPWLQGIRPLLMLSFWINYKLSAEDTFTYHLVNVVLHLLNGGLIFVCVQRLLKFARVRKNGIAILSAFAAGLFLLHPLQTESVSYIASRSETLGVFFFLAAFAVFLYRKTPAITWLRSIAVLLLFGAAVLSKEHTVVLPALLLLTDYYWNPAFSTEGIRRNWRLYVPMAVVAIAGGAFVVHILASATSAGFALKDLTWYQYFFTECRAIWHYVFKFVFPIAQNLDYDFPISRNILDHEAYIGLIALVGVAVLAWIFRLSARLESYGMFVFLLLLAPTSSFIPIRDTLVERRVYLPFIGLLLVLCGLLSRWNAKRQTMAVVFGVVLLFEAGLTWQRNRLWGDAIALWSDSAEKSPQKVRPNFQLAGAYYDAQRCADSAKQYSKTAQLEKPDFNLLLNWGLAYDCAGQSGAALFRLQEAANVQRNAHVMSQIGMEYAKQGMYPAALDALASAEQLDPAWTMTYVYRGNIYSLQGNNTRAAEEYRRALAVDPHNQVATDALSRVTAAPAR